MEPPRIISMEVSSSGRCDCQYRILTNSGVKYITTAAGALNAKALDDMDLDFQSVLPPLPYHEASWKTARITRNPSSGKLEAALSSAALPAVQTIWHSRMVDFLDIEKTTHLALLTQECRWKAGSGSTATNEGMVAKMARFYWELPFLETETAVYQRLEGQGIAPGFLGHIHEEGRVIGFLLEKIRDGRHAGPDDLAGCKAALRRFHALGFLHGDCNKYNFIIRPNGRVMLIDFDKAKACADPALLEAEVASLKAQLAETTGRGGGLMP